MKQELTLLIMAAGIGSRFGGLKQICPIGPNGEFLIDYSIYDAILAGFQKVVFVIKKENEDIFRKTIGNRIAKHIQVEYVFQSLTDLPNNYFVPSGREKPWGTAQAVLCAKDVIQGPFAIINADDFYGRDAYQVVADYLRNPLSSHTYCIVGYKVKNTLSSYGAVKRAVLAGNGEFLEELTECNIKQEGEMIDATPLQGAPPFSLEPDTLVSMNLFGLQPSVFNLLEKGFPSFLDTMPNRLTSEYLIPEALSSFVQNSSVNIEILFTNATWYGVTYPEDKDVVVKNIQALIQKGEYPISLWEK